jgi:hypothetical protein
MKVQVRGVFVTNTQVNGGPRQLYSQFVVRANHLDELVVLGTLTAPAASFLAAGESVVAVAERLGHENGTLVLKTYGHLMPIRRTEHAGLTPRGPLTAWRRPLLMASRPIRRSARYAWLVAGVGFEPT